ncbi:response regulator transcription factor [Campylobacter sp. MIT 97-5078]|uniref:response regulator transcription factor n=1 Tax=Campylobacter sp. MIT 97-5078 TaxID=1548153 RepID=UPI00051473BF|nr:response regulator transcription factor [Campylobacter sp. MIT 97-5078]KGI56985.1 chemotaxis protein CheY [Campylobacter sp. MIT 97-5078]TQR28183.1 DNA-binding response regulator [Campylobacter sp. MIT 97-5078]
MRILLIEDDTDLNELLTLRLQKEGFELESLFDFQGVRECLDEKDFDLLLVDRNLPSGDSIEKLVSLRKQGYNEPVIFLTAKSLQEDIIEGFKKGCDDYIIKPFDFNELVFRIKALLKRSKKESETLAYKDFLLDLNNHQCFFKDKEVILSNLEFELLKCFFENKNTLLSRQFLSENVWQDDNVNDKTINIALTRLRAKFPSLKEHIISVRGIGYKLC